jgi:hypothetical protein
LNTSNPNLASVADSLEVDERLLPYMPYLLQDLWALIDDGYLKHAGRMSRKGYEHYRDHDETVADLTVFGDDLLREASTTEATLRINDEYQRLIEKRGRELMAIHPELSTDIIVYLDGQADECRVILDHLEGAVWLLRKEQ